MVDVHAQHVDDMHLGAVLAWSTPLLTVLTVPLLGACEDSEDSEYRVPRSNDHHAEDIDHAHAILDNAAHGTRAGKKKPGIVPLA